MVLNLPGAAREMRLGAAAEIISEAPVILSAGTALPPNMIEQRTLAELLRALWGARYDGSRRWRSTFDQIQRTVRVDRRYLALPVSEYPELDSFAKTNAAWSRVAPELAAAAIERALVAAGLAARDIDHLFFITGTGVATPSIDARLVNRMGMRPDVRRTPIFGLGCAGGVAGVIRAADVLQARPGDIAMVVSAELCSLTLQRDDDSVANVIASALFGDGAAAIALGGARLAAGLEAGAPRVIASRSVFYPDSERMMGWDVVESGFRIVLSPAIPELVRERLAIDVDAMLAQSGVARNSITHWIAHTGGNRVLDAIAAALELPAGALERSWRLLAATGNLSSASVLFVMRDLLESGAASPGDYGLMLAMGPGFCAELALLGW
jgi:alkylresorcinol/alkylpyrone synthase